MPDPDTTSRTLRIAALLATIAVVAATILIVALGGEEQKPQTIVPLAPEPKSLSAAGFTKQDDGRFDPEGFGMTFDYPAGMFEMLSPEGESSHDDDTLGISERRRHFLFPDKAADTTDVNKAQAWFRVIRVTYEDSFNPERFAEFRADLAREQVDKPTAITEIGGVPSFSREYEIAGATGESTYFASGDNLYQLISSASADDHKAVQKARKQILASVDFSP